MLNLVGVENIPFEMIESTSFDIGIFASGYESRSIHLAKQLDLSRISKILVLGFTEHGTESTRTANDAFYNQNMVNFLLLSSQEESKLYSTLIEMFAQLSHKEKISLLIDYTSMSRLWYSGILNYVRFQESLDIDVYLTYSIGAYKGEFLDYNYSSINSLPSHEGSLSANVRTLLVLAVGFSPYLVKSVIEEIEPNVTLGIVAMPRFEGSFFDKVAEIREILEKDVSDWVLCPIHDLEYIFRTYAEITSNNIFGKDIMFLSLGPKILTLASILVGQRFETVTCLYLRSAKKRAIDVQPEGTIICNRVTYRANENQIAS